MDTTKVRLLAAFLLALSSLNICSCQQNAIFNQSPFQRSQQNDPFRQQLQQQQQRQQQFSGLSPLSPLNASPFNAIPPIAPLLPQSPYRNYNQLNPQGLVPITAYQNEINYDGSFAYGYTAGDGTTAQAQGYVKNLGLGEAVEAQVIQGSYSYTSPEGTPITVRYIADENGFRAEGAHIPTPPPLPPYQQVLNPNLNPYQTPFRQFPQQQTLRPGQQLNPLQLQQQQRLFQQQNSGQYQSEGPFGGLPQQNIFGAASGIPGQYAGQFNTFGLRNNFNQPQTNFPLPQQNQQNFTQQQGQQNLQQQNLQQQQQQQLLQQQQQQQQNHQQQNHQQLQQNAQQQQQLATQQLRGRPNQLINPYGYDQYRRFKKATKK